MSVALSSVKHKYYEIEFLLWVFSKFCVYTDTPRLVKSLRSERTSASGSWLYIWSNTYVYTTKPSWNHSSNTLTSDRPQHDRHAACVITQQYSSATFVSLRFHSRQITSDRPQHDHHASCVITQQYSSATFVSLRFHSRPKKMARVSKLFSVFNFFI